MKGQSECSWAKIGAQHRTKLGQDDWALDLEATLYPSNQLPPYIFRDGVEDPNVTERPAGGVLGHQVQGAFHRLATRADALLRLHLAINQGQDGLDVE